MRPTAAYLIIFISSFLLFDPLFMAIGHDRWYPHPHAKDVEKMLKRGEEMKGYILFLTLLFVALLSGMAVFVLRRGQEEATRRIAQEHERLSELALKAAHAALPHLAQGDIPAAIEAALIGYSGSPGKNFNRVRSAMFRMGDDRVSIRAIELGDAQGLELRAVCGEAGVICLVNAGGSIEIKKFERKTI
jgi:hypothetical protein